MKIESKNYILSFEGSFCLLFKRKVNNTIIMKRNHAAKKVVGTLILILSILTLLMGALTVFLYLNPQVIDEFDKFMVETLQLKNADGTTPQSSKVELPTAISTPIVGVVFFLIGAVLLKLSSNKSIIKMHDVFGFGRYGAVNIKFWWLFILVGLIGEFVAAFFYQEYPEPAGIGLIASGSLMVIGLLMLIPMPSNFVVKRKHIGDTMIISWPKNGLCNGRFAPSVILNELSAMNMLGYTHVKKIFDNEDCSGRVTIIFENTEFSKEEMRQKKADYLKLAAKALKKNEPIPTPFFVEEFKHEGPTKKEVTTSTSSVNDYDIVTTYGDGHTERTHHYKNVTTTSVAYYKNQYIEYVFNYKDDEKEHTVYDDDRRPLSLLVYKGRKQVG